MSTVLRKLDPRYSMYLRGFDRRGAVAALTDAALTSFNVYGVWNDLFDFAVLVLYDADDQYGHLYTSKYLPDFDLTGIVIDFDVAYSNVFNPVSTRFDSLESGQLSFITHDPTTGVETSGSVSLAEHMVTTTGGSYSAVEITLNGTSDASTSFSMGFMNSFTINVPSGSGSAADDCGNIEFAVNHNAYVLFGQALVPFCIAEIVSGSFTNKLKVYAGRSAFINNGTLTSPPPDQFSFSGAVMSITRANLYSAGVYDYRALVGFWGLQVGDPVLVLTYVGSAYGYERHTVSSVTSPWEVTLDSAPSTPIMVFWPMYGYDGNTQQMWLHIDLDNGTSFTAGGLTGTDIYPKLSGGIDPTSYHVTLDLTTLGIDKLRQLWLTFSPELTIDTVNANQTLNTTNRTDWSVQVTNWSMTDPGSKITLKIAGPGSTVVTSQDTNLRQIGTWSSNSNVDFAGGRGLYSNVVGSTLLVNYACQYTHDLYIGMYQSPGGSDSNITLALDGAPITGSPTTLLGSYTAVRRLIQTSVAAGMHVLSITVNSANDFYFDYVHAAVASDVPDPVITYPDVGMSLDYDTDETYKLSPQRSLFVARTAGFLGDVDFYGGVFFALQRLRSGGSLHSATILLGGSLVDGDVYSLTIGTTTLGVGVHGNTNWTALVQRMVNGINATFVGVFAAPTGTTGQFKITCLSAINGFSLSTTAGSSLTVSVTGDLGVITTGSSIYLGGQEGAWGIDTSVSTPLNSGFINFLRSFCTELVANSMTCTVAWSQELLHPPDVNTISGAWTQRFADSTPVLTATGFGSWGAGFVEGVTATALGSTIDITQTAHGYITGNVATFASNSGDTFPVIVLSADSYELDVASTARTNVGSVITSGTAVSRLDGAFFASTMTKMLIGNTVYDVASVINSFTIVLAQSAGVNPQLGWNHVPIVNDAVTIALQTTQCAFSSSTAQPYVENVFKQTAAVMEAAGLIAWLQLGEIGHWFFSRIESMIIVGFSQSGSLIQIETVADNGFVTGQTAIVAGSNLIDGTHTITVTGGNTFTIDGSTWPGGSPAAKGTISGGGMAYYDANQSDAASTSLSRSLAPFYTQDDDPTINSSADSNFLAARVKNYTDAIIAGVLAAHPTAKFEVLWPNDVNFATCYYTPTEPYPQGGRMNHAVNLPVGWQTKSGSGFDRFKIEALSWGSQYVNIDNAKETMQYPFTDLSWDMADTRYLIPWFNGGCPWKNEYAFATNVLIPFLNFWAFDHFVLFSWPLPLPSLRGSTVVYP